MWVKSALLSVLLVLGVSVGPTSSSDEGSPFLDMASVFIQEALNNQNGNANAGGNGAGLAGVASLIGTFMQASNGKSGSGAAQILTGLGSLLANSGGNGNSGGGFDPSIIGNVLEMFANTDSDDDEPQDRRKRDIGSNKDSGIGMDAILQMASLFMNAQGSAGQKRSANGRQQEQDNGLVSLLPMVMQAINSFAGPEGQRTQEKHKSHAWVLPPFLEQIHVLWDHFSNSDLADALYKKSGAHAIFKGFTGRDGKLDYDKLFESLNNQSFRRRWIKAATVYLADWANYLANPDVYQRYFQTAQVIVNGFLKSQGFPKSTLFDPSKPSETISSLLDHVAKQHLNVKIDSRAYVKPAVGYAKELLKLGQARGLLQKFNATELSDKLTDTLNLEVIEPVLKVHRAYRYVLKTPQCEKYVLCDMNSHDDADNVGLTAVFKPRITKVGSMAAALFISTETGTPFWTLFGVINDPNNCDARYPVDCSGFHEGEAKVTTEYVHNEL